MNQLLMWIDGIDKAVVNWFQAYGNGNPVTPLVEFLTNQRNFLIPMIIGFLAMIIWGGKRGRTLAMLLVPLLLLTDVFTVKIIKPIIGRARPFEPDSIASMPSAHATNLFGAALLFSVGWVKNLWGRVALFTTAFIFAFTRVYVGVHHPSDIIVGAIIGMLDALIVIALYSFIRPYLANRFKLFDENIFVASDSGHAK